VIRESAVVPVVLPELKPNKPWSIEHDSMMGELVAYSPHPGPGLKLIMPEFTICWFLILQEPQR